MSEETKNQFDLENLVVLKFNFEHSRIEVLPASIALEKDKNLSINLNSSWKYIFEGTIDPNFVRGIGQSLMYFPPGFKGGVIGVYDQTKIEHLNGMAMASGEVMRYHNPHLSGVKI
jgi:hypothetical protein